MSSKDRLNFLLQITDYFHGHWEDPEWGRLPATQLLIALAIRELATGIQDAEIRGHIHAAADKSIGKNGQILAKP